MSNFTDLRSLEERFEEYARSLYRLESELFRLERELKVERNIRLDADAALHDRISSLSHRVSDNHTQVENGWEKVHNRLVVLEGKKPNAVDPLDK